MVYLREFLPLVMPFVRQCPQMTATLYLRQSAIEFCERTDCWRHVATQTLTVQDPAITVPGFAVLHRIEHAEFAGNRLEPIAYTDSTAPVLPQASKPTYIAQGEDGRLMVLPFATGDVTVSMFLKPRQGTAWGQNGAPDTADYYDQVPDFMLHSHGAPIAAGAIARLMRIPDVPWTDLRQSEVFQVQAEYAMRSRFTEGMKGQQRAPIRTKTLWF